MVRQGAEGEACGPWGWLQGTQRLLLPLAAPLQLALQQLLLLLMPLLLAPRLQQLRLLLRPLVWERLWGRLRRWGPGG